MSDEKERLHEWKTHTPGLMKEVMLNPGCAILAKPINIFLLTLASVAERASLINDPVLNKLMMQLALYEMADPYSKEYDSDLVSKYMEKYSSFRDDLPEPFKPEKMISVNDDLPKDKQYVLAHIVKNNWGDNDDPKGLRYFKVVKFERGLSKSDRDKLPVVAKRKYHYYPADERDNNKRAYCWGEFGPGAYWGQEVDYWMELPLLQADNIEGNS